MACMIKKLDGAAVIDALGGTTAVARLLGIKPPSVHGWRETGIPETRVIQLGAQIEAAMGIPRWELVPHQWHRIWPELVGAEGAPVVSPEVA